MRLVLSSAAAREAPPRELFDGCTRRGLAGVELVSTSGRGFRFADGVSAMEIFAAATAVGLEVAGLYCEQLAPDQLDDAARLSGLMAVPVVVPIEGFDRPLLPRAAESFDVAGGRLYLAHAGDPHVAEAIRNLVTPLPHAASLGLAWQVRPGVDDATRLTDVIDAAGDLLRYVRLHGGGPEAHAQAGLGIGVLMARLALARFDGPIVLTPSNPSYHYAWNAWLGRGGGWGCGSKQSDASLLTLAPAVSTATATE